jgi:hypothetical protein
MKRLATVQAAPDTKAPEPAKWNAATLRLNNNALDSGRSCASMHVSRSCASCAAHGCANAASGRFRLLPLATLVHPCTAQDAQERPPATLVRPCTSVAPAHPVLHMDVRMPRAHGCARAAARDISASMHVRNGKPAEAGSPRRCGGRRFTRRLSPAPSPGTCSSSPIRCRTTRQVSRRYCRARCRRRHRKSMYGCRRRSPSQRPCLRCSRARP